MMKYQVPSLSKQVMRLKTVRE